MYNLIGNSCAACLISKNHFNEKFNNPFCYCVIDFNSMITLIKNYSTINFSNFKLKKDNNCNFSIIIDNVIEVKYVHYKFSPNYDLKIDNITHDIKSNHIWTYIVEKYIERLKRMINSSPIFIIASVENCINNYTDNQLLDILSLNVYYKIICASHKNISFKNTSNREFIKIPQNIKTNGVPLAEYIYKNSKLLFE